MDNKEKYKSIFIESLAIDLSKFNENIKYNEIPEWDSIGHMTLMSGLEDGFNINTNYNFIGSHLDIHNSNYSTISMSDVHLLDLSLTKNFYGIEVGFSINNLLDESFQAPHGFSQDGRNLSFVFKSSF